MKIISAAMQAHLRQDVTTLTTCWKIKRMDGKIFAFTELDQDITYLGDVFKSTGGFNKSAIKNAASMAVDNLEVTGFLSDDTIAEDELRNGAFDYAEVEIFMINYMDLSMGTIKLRYGFFGEVKTAPSGAFLVELRGLIQLLAQKIGEVYTPECRADLGDDRCKVKMFPDEHVTGRLYRVGDRVLAYRTPGARKSVVAVPIANTNMEDTSGWSTSAQMVANVNFVTPYDGAKFAYLSRPTHNLQQLATLVTGGVTAVNLSEGRMRLRFTGWFNSVSEGNRPRVQITYYTGVSGGTIISTSTHDFDPPLFRTWQFREFVEFIPTNARSMRINISIGSTPDFGYAGLGVDKINLEMLWPDEEVADFSQFAGVEYVATVAGRAATTPPVFNPTLGSTTKDGAVEWVATAPTFTFLDQVAIDSVDSSTLVLSTVNKPDGWFDWGVMKILTGENAGIAVEPMTWTQATKTLKLAMPLPHKTLAGTYVQIMTGCDKRRSTCKTKFANLLNFRGEPDIPGVGEYFKVAGLG
jgi:hypothetical protein